MDKTVGKIFCAIIALWCLPCYAGIVLRALDIAGQPLEHIAPGELFQVEVTIEGGGVSAQQRPEIKGAEHCYIRNAGLMVTTINGDTTIKHKYRARFDTAGVFTLGPALISRNGSLESSNSVSVRVTDQLAAATRPARAASSGSGAFLRFSTDKERVVVGEKIKCLVRFYYAEDVTNLAPITRNELPGFSFVNDVETSRGSEEISGKSYNYVDFSWDMVPTVAGKRVIPAYHTDYFVRSKQDAFINHLSLFFGHGGEKKKVYSNASTIMVDELPPYKGPVHAIGNYTHFNAYMNPGVAKEGEGMVLTLEIEGEGNLATTHNAVNVQLPESFKYYDSKNYVVDPKNGGPSKHCFEFIVQGLQKGNFEIPPQSFNFFDIKNRQYKTLQTLPSTVTILPSPNMLTIIPQMPSETETKPTSTAVDVSADIRALHSGAWYAEQERALPLWLLLLLALVPVLVLMVPVVRNIQWPSRIVSDPVRRKKIALKTARNELKIAGKVGNGKQIYTMFINFFAASWDLPLHQITHDSITHKLQELGYDKNELEQWHQFFNQLSENAFFNTQTKPGATNILIQYAAGWLDRFEKKI